MNITNNMGPQEIFNCVNFILQLITNGTSAIIQVNQNFHLSYPVFQQDFFKRRAPFVSHVFPNIYIADLEKVSVLKFISGIKSGTYNNRAQFIFIARYLSNSDVTFLVEEYMVNFIFINISTGEVQTVFPYKTRNLHDFSTDLVKIGSCGNSDFDEKIFSDKLPSSWDNSTLIMLYRRGEPYTMISNGKRKGVEFDLIDIFVKKLGVKAHYIDQFFLRSHLMILALYISKFDIHFGNEITLTFKREEYAFPYTCTALYWHVPKPDIIPKWQLIFHAFSVDLYVLWGVIVILFSVLWFITYTILKNQKFSNNFFNKLWVILSIIMEQPGTYTTEFGTVIILLLLIFQSSMIMNVLYKAKYTSLLSSETYNDEINSFEDIMEKKLRVGSTLFERKIYRNTPDIKKYMDQNYVQCDDGNGCLFQSVLTKDLAVLRSTTKVDYFHHLLEESGNFSYLIRILPAVAHYFNCFVSPRGHPIFPTLNKYMFYFVDHGFVNMVMSKYNIDSPRKKNPENIQLNFEDVKAAFILLLSGNSAAGLIFLIEKLVTIYSS